MLGHYQTEFMTDVYNDLGNPDKGTKWNVGNQEFDKLTKMSILIKWHRSEGRGPGKWIHANVCIER